MAAPYARTSRFTETKSESSDSALSCTLISISVCMAQESYGDNPYINTLQLFSTSVGRYWLYERVSSSESTMIVSFIVGLIMAPFNIIYWIKWTITYITILLRKSLHSGRFDLYDINAFGDPIKLGYIVPPLEKELESPNSGIPFTRSNG
ncbi:hypothetical protein CEXT_302721 [Caerostris extrusa]|uniref:Uncharacterized protein n=1 Tax=Caerostris extrusa TaxID=172846 RepID=A0AAV4NF70_CAEEX|nr:hypothetical protein CEXT_302721 [Caerostris extrusa]